MIQLTLQQIGVVRSPKATGGDESWGEVPAEIHLNPDLTPGLLGLEEFSHISVLFYMHKALEEERRVLVRRPRDRSDMPEMGIFAQRTRYRPNPIGLTTVRLLQVTGNILQVQGLDALDGTPVLDIKPYFPVFDVREARVPKWVPKLMEGYFENVSSSGSIKGLDHVQVAAPEGCEETARRFYGEILGMPEIPKPEELRKRGGVWFQCGKQQIHVGVEIPYVPAKKAHPAFEVQELSNLGQRLMNFGISVIDDNALPGAKRFHTEDPFGNRLEFLEWE